MARSRISVILFFTINLARCDPSMECFIFFFFFLPLFFLPHEDITNRENIFERFASTRKEINNRGPIKGGRGASTVGVNRLRSPWRRGFKLRGN